MSDEPQKDGAQKDGAQKDNSEIGLAAFYNAIYAPRGFGAAPHHIPLCMALEDTRIRRLIAIGPPGCLSGGTVFDVIHNGVRRWLSLTGMYEIWMGNFDTDFRIFSLKDGVIGRHKAIQIVKSGVKATFSVRSNNGTCLRVTEEHPFRVPFGGDEEGFKPLKLLRVGEKVVVRAQRAEETSEPEIDTITAIEKHGEEMTYDIVMDDPYHNYVAHNFVVHNTGKSTVTSQAYPAWRLGRDPKTTILGVSAAEKLMQGFMSAVMQIIEYSPHYKAIFPNVRPDKDLGWSGEKGLYVTGRVPGDPDASFFPAGIDSKTLTGLHAKEIIMDDLHDRRNSASSDGCKMVLDTYYDTLIGRGDPQSARYILSGRRFHQEDVYGKLLESGEWVVMRLPAERPSSENNLLYYDLLVPRDPAKDSQPIRCVFSENYEPLRQQDDKKPYIQYKLVYGVDPTGQGFYWPAMPDKRREYFEVKRNSPAKAKAVYQCDPRERENPIFSDDDFAFYHNLPAEELNLGVNSALVRGFVQTNQGQVIQSWDTAFGKSSDSAYTVCVTAVLIPSNRWWRDEDQSIYGECETHNRVYILNVSRQKITFPQLVGEVKYLNSLWKPQVVLIENQASGISLIQSLRNSSVPIQAVGTKEGKVERAINAVGGSVGSAQGWFGQHRVVLPAAKLEWIDPFITEFKDFSGKGSGKKDQVDATVQLVNFAIAAAVGRSLMPSDAEDLVGPHKDFRSKDDPRAAGVDMIDFLGSVHQEDPFSISCGRCDNWAGHAMMGDGKPNVARKPFCRLHKFASSAVGTCEEWIAFGETEKEKQRAGW